MPDAAERDLGSRGDALQEHFERAPLATLQIDGESLFTLYANRAALDLAGLEPREILGRRLDESLPGLVGEHLLPLLIEVGKTGAPLHRAEVGFTNGQGNSRCWCASAWRTTEKREGTCRLLLQLTDISEDVEQRQELTAMARQMRQINEELVLSALREEELTQRAEAANDAKSAFLATMSHELRTPLTAIIGYEELLSDGITGPVTPEQRTQLHRIRDSAMHLLALIEQILTLSRLATEHEKAQSERMTLESLVQATSVLIAPLAAEKRLGFRTELPQNDVVFESDPLKVKQILINLLANAVRFTDQGEVTLRARVEGKDLVIEVHDTGIGIAGEHLDQIFEPFYQVEQKATRRVGGSGLGLSVSRRLARLLGGDVTVASIAGHGSDFTLRIPTRGRLDESGV